MTEAEWFANNNGVALAKQWGERFTERKARLLMLACCMRHGHLLTDPPVREAVEALTAHYADPTKADRPFDEQDTRTLYTSVDDYTRRDEFFVDGEPGFQFYVACALKVAVKSGAMAAEDEYSLPLVEDCMLSIVGGIAKPAKEELAQQAELVREILGNPFRPVEFVPAWRTSTVVAVARGIYEDQAFDQFPILADALEDAGCADTDMLAHCRNPGQHVRGCWVVDLLLGKGTPNHSMASEVKGQRNPAEVVSPLSPRSNRNA